MKNLIKTLQASTSYLLILAFMFVVFEPAISKAIEDQFTVTQVVTAEISFLTPGTDITMSPSLAGITGGTSNGQTTIRVLTNNALGYNMTLTASSSLGMIGNSQGGTIPAYIHIGSTTPQFVFTTPTDTARFGYTVEASTTADLATAFKDTGAICGAGSGDTVDACWINASTSAVTIINRTTATAASGSTSTIKFRTVIDSNPVPAVPQDTYVATTTLTATVNP
ncbi:MAG: hypothetical protein V4697_01300 [Patescibacteria group bacterium]